MTLKERARTWLGITTPPPQSSAGLHPPSHAAGQRLRISSDNPSLALYQGLTLLAPYDPEARWRGLTLDEATLSKMDSPRLLELLVDLSPEISQALWHLLRLANPGWEVKAYTLTGQADTIDARAQAALDQFLLDLQERHGSADVIINRLYIGAFMRGAFMAELVLDNAGRRPLDIAVPDAVWTYFRIFIDRELGPVWEPYQFQRGLAVSLMVPTVRYVPVDPLPASPYGRPLASPALFTALFTLSLLHDLRRVIAQQGYPRIDVMVKLEELAKSMPPDIAADPVEMNRWVTEIVNELGKNYNALEPDSAWIHTDVSEVQKNLGVVGSDSLGAIGPLVEFLERSISRALKSNALMMGLSGSSNETQANRNYEIMIAGIRSLQQLCEGLLEHLLALALQAQGLQARVKFRFDELRQAELLRDAQVASLKAQNAFFAYQAGWVGQDEAAMEGIGKDKADQPEPRMPPAAFKINPSEVQDPGAAQPNPGSMKASALQGTRTANGHGPSDDHE